MHRILPILLLILVPGWSHSPAAAQDLQLPELRTEQDRARALQQVEQWLTGVIAEARSGRGTRLILEGTGQFGDFEVIDRQATADFLEAQVIIGAITPAEQSRQAQALSFTSPAALANAEAQLEAIRREVRNFKRRHREDLLQRHLATHPPLRSRVHPQALAGTA